MGKKITYIMSLFVVCGLVALYYFYPHTAEGPTDMSNSGGTQVACTMEAKQCPDGSYVGREGPRCEFRACPVAGNVASSSVTLALGESGTIDGAHITPQRIVEDSRCPIDVTCIQAGTVKVDVGIMPGAESVMLTLHETIPWFPLDKRLLLTEVTPVKRSNATITPSDYRFTFMVVSK